jgi:SAM-dependent methyltransferase
MSDRTSVLRDYSRQAETYDATRGASPSVLGPLREVLSSAPGRRLADIGGGTGNYAHALRDDGWRPLVIDRSAAMLARAAVKGLETLEADAQRLPLPDASVDAAMLVSMLHHVDDPHAALDEALRIVRPGGPVVVIGWTREDIADLWYGDYFPSTRTWIEASHPPLNDLIAHLPGARHEQIVFGDLVDGSLAALAAHPDRVLDPAVRRQTSFFERLERDRPQELRAGLERLARDIEAGGAPQAVGRITLLVATAR